MTELHNDTSSSTGPSSSTQLRARFASRLSFLYGTEVPAYTSLVQVSQQVNDRVLARMGRSAERLGTSERITAERHGAIRVGSAAEMAQVARIFAAVGMFPCGFYDLRSTRPTPVPVVSTAFRPLDRDELAINPFRIFASMLVPQDRRFFSPSIEQRLNSFLNSRQLFNDEVLQLADRAIADGYLNEIDSGRFLDLAVDVFALSREPVDRAWYRELEAVSSVAADIGGVTSTHINHLTPRVLDIDGLYSCMQDRNIEMIDKIQGPPRWDGPDVLLRQTSFRALAETREFREANGEITQDSLRVRFGEVEARGIALTPSGRDLYEQIVRTVEEKTSAEPIGDAHSVAVGVWEQLMPRTEKDLCLQGLGYFTYHIDTDALRRASDSFTEIRQHDVTTLVRDGILIPEPIVYEDFLPRSAAGIFASNLTDSGLMDQRYHGAERNIDWMSDVLGTEVAVPEDIYAQESADSVSAITKNLNRSSTRVPNIGQAR